MCALLLLLLSLLSSLLASGCFLHDDDDEFNLHAGELDLRKRKRERVGTSRAQRLTLVARFARTLHVSRARAQIGSQQRRRARERPAKWSDSFACVALFLCLRELIEV